MTRRIKSVTAHVVKGKKNITFRAVLTIVEIVAAAMIALSQELPTGQTVALMGAIGAAISAVVNVINESGLLDLILPKGGESDAAH